MTVGVPARISTLKLRSARDIICHVYYAYLSSMMSHLLTVGSGWGWEEVFHDSKEYLETLNDSILVSGSKIWGNTFGECSFGTIVNVIQQSYPYTVWRVHLFGFRVGPRIDSMWAPSWVTQSWAELSFLIRVRNNMF